MQPELQLTGGEESQNHYLESTVPSLSLNWAKECGMPGDSINCAISYFQEGVCLYVAYNGVCSLYT